MYQQMFKRTKFVLFLASIVFCFFIFGGGILFIVKAFKSCESVKCEQVIDGTTCTLTYNNITCLCSSNHDLKEFTRSVEDCYMGKEDPCPRMDRGECIDISFTIGGSFLLAVSFGIILISCSIYHFYD